MAERANCGFVESYYRVYRSRLGVKTTAFGDTIECSSTAKYRKSKGCLVKNLVEGNPDGHEVMSQALVSERLVDLALRPLLAPHGFQTVLAPQSIEQTSIENKGVDLIVTDNDGMVFLGIDVKMRRGRSKFNRDGFGWHQNLMSPYIYLSLGNWGVDIRERDEAHIRDWLSHCVLPHLPASGKIPQFNQFRSYLAGRIERSLEGYLERIENGASDNRNFGLPGTHMETDTLSTKLLIMQKVFSGINQELGQSQAQLPVLRTSLG